MPGPIDIPHMYSPEDVLRFVRRELAASADAEKAEQMARYMKTNMPFYGVQKPGREHIARSVKWHFRPSSHTEYEDLVRLLWAQNHREEKYLAVQFARTFRLFITSDALPLYEFLIRDGAWWDFVDDVAIRLVGSVLRHERDAVSSLLDRWIEDDDRWIRRSAIIAQVMHRSDTDEARLFRYCRACLEETDPFIRKAIGWALRDYAKASPNSVARFVQDNSDAMARITYMEATKGLPSEP